MIELKKKIDYDLLMLRRYYIDNGYDLTFLGLYNKHIKDYVNYMILMITK